MVEADGRLGLAVEHVGHAVGLLEDRADLRDPLAIAHVDVGHLVVSHGEGLARPGIEQFPAEVHLLHAQEARPAQHAIERDGVAHRRDAVFREHDDRVAPSRGPLAEVAGHAVDLGAGRAGLRGVGPEPLEVVVEVGQVRERDGGIRLLDDLARGRGDPCRRADVGRRPPEVEQRKPAEGALQVGLQRGRVGVEARDLATVGRIDGPGRRGDVHRGVHVEPPEHLGHREAVAESRAADVPEFVGLAADEAIALPPEHHLGEIAVIPAVGHDPVVARRPAGEHRGLGTACHGGEHRAERGGEARTA